MKNSESKIVVEITNTTDGYERNVFVINAQSTQQFMDDLQSEIKRITDATSVFGEYIHPPCYNNYEHPEHPNRVSGTRGVPLLPHSEYVEKLNAFNDIQSKRMPIILSFKYKNLFSFMEKDQVKVKAMTLDEFLTDYFVET